jgi:hypothetical protein
MPGALLNALWGNSPMFMSLRMIGARQISMIGARQISKNRTWGVGRGEARGRTCV